MWQYRKTKLGKIRTNKRFWRKTKTGKGTKEKQEKRKKIWKIELAQKCARKILINKIKSIAKRTNVW